MEGTARGVGRFSLSLPRWLFLLRPGRLLNPVSGLNLPNPGQRKLARGIVSGVCEPVMVKESVSAPTRSCTLSLAGPPLHSMHDASLLIVCRSSPVLLRTRRPDVPRDQKLLLRSADVH